MILMVYIHATSSRAHYYAMEINLPASRLVSLSIKCPRMFHCPPFQMPEPRKVVVINECDLALRERYFSHCRIISHIMPYGNSLPAA